MSKIFISYAKQDKVIARKIVSRLESGGISCWISPRDVKDTSNRNKETREAVRKCDTFIMILSKFSENSNDQKSLIIKAAEAEIPIIPIKVGALQDTLTMEYFLQTLEWVDIYGDGFETAYEVLIEIIDEIFDENPELSKNTIKPKHGNADNKTNRNYIIAAVAAVLIILTAFYIFKDNDKNKDPEETNVVKQDIVTNIPSDVSLSSSDKKLVGRWRVIDYQDTRIIPEADKEQTAKAIESIKRSGLLIFQANKVFRRIGFTKNEQSANWEFDEYGKKIFLRVGERTETMNLASFSDSLMTMTVQETVAEGQKKKPVSTRIVFKKIIN